MLSILKSATTATGLSVALVAVIFTQERGENP